jgi:hypothetical protein
VAANPARDFRGLWQKFQDALYRTAGSLGIVDPDDPGVVASGWRRAHGHVPYVPEWADPEWAPNIQYSINGKERRELYVTTGEVLRPAILPRDADRNPTDFARYGTTAHPPLRMAKVTYVSCGLPEQINYIAASVSIPTKIPSKKIQLSVGLSSHRQVRPRRTRWAHGHLKMQRLGRRIFSKGQQLRRSVMALYPPTKSLGTLQ